MQKVSKKLPKILQIRDYWLVSPSLQRSMLTVCVALLPGILCSIYYFGVGMLQNIGLGVLFGMLIELAFHIILGRKIKQFALDGRGLVMSVIFALSLPASIPCWIFIIGLIIAIAFGKYVYGGNGNNVFNSAMVGVAALLLSFPADMTQWQPDAIGGASPLSNLQTGLRMSHMVSEMQNQEIFGVFGAYQHEWINFAFLLGGILLIQQRIIRWHIPLGVIAGLFISACLFQIIDDQRFPGGLFNLFSGATMLCAFFIATDPTTSPSNHKARFIYGCLIGLGIYCVRTWGSYADGVAFVILLMNAMAPLLEYYSCKKATQ